MSYVFAVWEGPPPLSNAHAVSEFDRRLAARSNEAPTPGVQAFVHALQVKFPDDRVGTAGDFWELPLEDQVDGSLAYLRVDPAMCEQLGPFILETAAAMELVAFDPQRGQLLPSAIQVARTADFELPAADDLPLHLTAVIGEALGAGVTMAGVLEQRETEFYVQWLARNGALTIEAQGERLLAPEHRLSDEGRNQMMSLGFTEADPNWRLHWDDGLQSLDQAGQILGHVLTAIRRLPLGTAMAIQTFPI